MEQFYFLLCQGAFGKKIGHNYSSADAAKSDALNIINSLSLTSQHLELYCQGPEYAHFVWSSKSLKKE